MQLRKFPQAALAGSLLAAASFALVSCGGKEDSADSADKGEEDSTAAPDSSGPGKIPSTSGSVKVGVLHSLSGTMAISETSLRDILLFTFDEINAKGGVLGKKIEPVVVDGASDWPLFAEKAEQLLV